MTMMMMKMRMMMMVCNYNGDDGGHDKIKLEGHDCDNEDDAY